MGAQPRRDTQLESKLSKAKDLTDEEITEMAKNSARKLMEEFDTDKNGFIEKEELKNFPEKAWEFINTTNVLELGQQTESKIKGSEKSQIVFQLLDQNNDQKISEEELCAVFEDMLKQVRYKKQSQVVKDAAEAKEAADAAA